MRQTHVSSGGFSLVELSIVLVILGLLTGGILTGQSLIKAAELRSITQEQLAYQTAVNTFKDKYLALPGDMRNATAFWGAANTAGTGGECAAPGTNAGTAPQTCNGDGNGTITTNQATATYELFRFWQHLGNAGLVEGSFSGVQGSAPNIFHSIIGTNVPRSKYSSGGWAVMNLANYAGNALYFNADYGNYLAAGTPIVNGATENRLLTPEQMWNIDTKVDDGKPGRGKVLTLYWDDCTSAANDDDTGADYNLSVTTVSCTPMFVRAF